MQDVNGMISSLLQTAVWIEAGGMGFSKTNRRELVKPLKRRLLSDSLLSDFKRRLEDLSIKYTVTPIPGAGGIVYVDIDRMVRKKPGPEAK